MKCPVCDVDLGMSEREGVEIDYCPQCRGYGEIDKIVERSDRSTAMRAASVATRITAQATRTNGDAPDPSGAASSGTILREKGGGD